MRRAMVLAGIILLVASAPGVVLAEGQNPNVKLAMHLVATDAYLDCTSPQLVPSAPSAIDPSVTQAEVDAAGGYVYMTFVAYDLTAVSGVEFAIGGWPTSRGAPAKPTLTYCPEGTLVLGDPWSGGGVVSWGLGSCWQSDVDGPVLPIGWAVQGWGGLGTYLPLTLSYAPSGYSYPTAPHNYTLDCTNDYVEDPVVREYPCVIGGEVTPSVEVAGPNGGEVIPGGTTQDITWYSFGLTQVDIEYTTDGSTWLPAGRSTATQNFTLNTFSWAVPEVASTTCKVRVKDTDGDPIDESDDFFEITAGGEQTITVTSPNNGQGLGVGSYWPIEWTSEGIDNVRIEYGLPDAKAWTEIVASTPAATGSYLWHVPNNPGEWHIRICDAADGDPCDITDQVFLIYQLINISAPSGGEQWMVGSHHNIAWTHVGVDNIGIVYGQSGNWMQVVDTMPAPTGFYNWEIPNNPGTWRVGIYDRADGNPFSISNEFQIYAPSVTVTQPNGGEQWLVGSQQAIQWTSHVDPTIITNVSIEFATDAAKQTWQTIVASTANDGEYLWTVPNLNSTSCAVRICALDSPLEACDTSDDLFEIYQTVEVTSPNGGEEWAVGSTHDITWDSEGIEFVKIEYGVEDGKGWTTIEESISAGATPYSWQVPDTPGEFLVRVCDAEDLDPCDTSDAVFTIAETLTLTSPVGGEEWMVGSQHDITWESEGIQNVDIYYGEYDLKSGESSTQGTLIVEGYDATLGSYPWTIPDDPGLWQVEIFDSEDGTPLDMSDYFEIYEPTVTVESPNGGEVWVVGSQHDILWDWRGDFTDVSIEYTTDWESPAKTTWVEVTAGTPNDGLFEWDVPNTPSENCKVRVCALGTSVPACDESDEVFEIQAQEYIEVLVPNGGEEWQIWTTHDITWTSVEVETLTIWYGDDSKGWTMITTIYNPAQGSYSWFVPNDPGHWLVKICDAMDNDPCDTSDDTFEIFIPSVTVTQPNGGEEWIVGDQEEITWTWRGEFDGVYMWYSTGEVNAKQVWNSIGYAPNTGSYLWTIPDDPSTTCLVRICPEFDDKSPVETGCDDSDDFFTIRLPEHLEVVLPAGGERWLVGTHQTLDWIAVEVEDIGIMYGQSGNWHPIEGTWPGGGHPYDWTVPDDPGIWKIAIYDASDGNPVAFSKDFEIYNTYSVAGCVDYMHNGDPVPGVELWMGEPERYDAVTGPGGCYEFPAVEGGGPYYVWPWKGDDVPLFTVMGWDAALCARAALGMSLYPPPLGGGTPLNGVPTHAESLSCDLNRDGQITMGDAENIANKAAGLPWWTSEVTPDEWIFEPEFREIPDLDQDLTDQDFSAVLLGDVDGNWGPLMPPPRGSAVEGVVASYNPQDFILEVFIRVRPVDGVVSMDCAVSYNPYVLEFMAGDIGSAFDGFSWVGNDNGMGLVYGCAFRPDPVSVRGVGPTVMFRVLQPEAVRDDGIMHLEGFYLNDQLTGYGPLALIGTTEIGMGGGLYPPRPNPFNPETSIGFSLPQGEPQHVSLKIYNLQGQMVRTLVDEVMDSGEHMVNWNGKNEAGVEVASGVFFAVFDSGDIHQTRKLMLLK